MRSEGISFDLHSPIGTILQGVQKGKTGKAVTTKLIIWAFSALNSGRSEDFDRALKTVFHA